MTVLGLPPLFAILLAVLGVQTAVPARAVTDPRDGGRYPVVEVAGMDWLGRNLSFAAEGSTCPRGDLDACEREGRLYPWAVALSACPAGWHLATEADWQALERALGMPAAELALERERGAGLGELPEPGGATGLDIPFAGWRRADGTFAVGNGTDRAAAIWTATRANDRAAWHRDLSSARSGIWRSPVNVTYRLSVRCVRD